MLRLFAIILLLFAVLMLFAKLLRRIAASIIAHAGNSTPRTEHDPKKEVLYNRDDIVVLKGDAESNNREDI